MIYYIKNIFKNKINLRSKSTYKIRGFSLIEVAVTLAIFAILATIMFTSYPGANNVLAYNFTTQEIIAKIKTIQIYGAGSGQFSKGAGLYFQKDNSYNNYITEFLDATTTITTLGVYDSNKYFNINLLDDQDPANDKIIAKDIIKNNVIINRICTKELYSSILTDCDKNLLSVTYVRPDTEANITDLSETNSVKNFFDIGYIEIKSKLLKNGQDLKCIQVYRNGQINVKNGACS